MNVSGFTGETPNGVQGCWETATACAAIVNRGCGTATGLISSLIFISPMLCMTEYAVRCCFISATILTILSPASVIWSRRVISRLPSRISHYDRTLGAHARKELRISWQGISRKRISRRGPRVSNRGELIRYVENFRKGSRRIHVLFSIWSRMNTIKRK